MGPQECGWRIPEQWHHLTDPLFLRFHLQTFICLGLKSFLILKDFN